MNEIRVCVCLMVPNKKAHAAFKNANQLYTQKGAHRHASLFIPF